MSTLTLIIISTATISLIALIGILFLSLKDELVKKILLALVGLSSGALMGGAFLHLIPEAVEKSAGTDVNIFIWIIISILIFFILEKVLHWRHCHKENCKVHTFGTMSLIGDGIHNFIDGLIIAAAFVADTNLGIATTIAIAMHEIPQEIGDFGVLLHSGYTKKKAILFNLLAALTVVLGGIVGYYITAITLNAELYLLPIAAGGFIYISASDLMPEIRKETSISKSLVSILFFILGVIIIYLV